MRRAFILTSFTLFSSALAVADPLPEHAARVVTYSIDVSLDAATHRLTGSEQVTWRNPSNDQIGELRLHLYLNAFRNSRSTFMRESGGQLRSLDMPENGWGWIDLTTLALADGTDLLKSARFDAPDDGNADDRTVIRVPLPSAVAPGGEVHFTAGFTAQLPRVFARSGYARDYHLVGQWFPKLGVYEPAGVRQRATGGWNCHQYHANSEFYADYGSFDVRITTPSRFVVGATGTLQGKTTRPDGTVTWRYVQDDVHDFGWTADPGFVEVRGHFSGTRDVSESEYSAAATLVNRPLDQMRLTDVDIRLLMQPAHMPQAQRYMESARQAIKHFGLWYGRYPYSTLTVVDPAYGGLGSGGMEYPTFFTGGTHMLLNRWPFDRMHVAEEVTIHEYGHQYWYGMVGSNEFEEAWLDEGFNSYSTGRLVDRLYGPATSVGTVLGLRIGHRDQLRSFNSPLRTFDRLRQPAWTYSPGSYSFYSYDRTDMALETLEHLLGEPTMARIMRTYSERWRFRHPSSDDFYAVASEVAGQDLMWFFKPVAETADFVDYEVSTADSKRHERDTGRLGEPATLTEAKEPEDTAPYDSVVILRRRGGIVLPQVVELTFEGGRRERVSWDGAARWKELKRTTKDRLQRAEIDPDHRIWLDVNWTNNSRRTAPDHRVATTWTARVLFWVQQVVSLAGL
jgi:peptidase M1-like protein